jgi:hypothetical protein
MKFCTKIKIRSKHLAFHISGLTILQLTKLGLQTNLGVKRIWGQYFMGSKFSDVKIFVRSTFFGGPKFGMSNIMGFLTF